MASAKHQKSQQRVKKTARTKAAPRKAVAKAAPKKVQANTKPLKASVKKVKLSRARAAAPKKASRAKSAPPILAKGLVSLTRTVRVTSQRNVIPVAEKPSALTCPLVLDGIIAPEAFSPRDCFSCDEFDCRFYAAEERSGLLGSRLFAGEEEGDEEGEETDPFGFGRGEDEGDTWGGEEDE